MDIFIYVIIGLFTGFLTGMFGIGGGSIRIPLLSLSGMSLINSFATNMFSIPFSSLMGAYIHRRNIEWNLTKMFTIGAVLGIIISTFIVGIISSKMLAILFCVAALITTVGLYLDKINCYIKPTKLNLFLGSFIGNLIMGSRGGSGGTLFPPILKSMNVEMKRAIATSLFTGFFSSIFAIFIYLGRGDILFIPAIIVSITGVLGSYFGSKVSMKTNSEILRGGLAFLVILFSLIIVYKEII